MDRNFAILQRIIRLSRIHCVTGGTHGIKIETLSLHAMIILAIIVLSYMYSSIVHIIYSNVYSISSTERQTHKYTPIIHRGLTLSSLLLPFSKKGNEIRQNKILSPFRFTFTLIRSWCVQKINYRAHLHLSSPNRFIIEYKELRLRLSDFFADFLARIWTRVSSSS